MQLVSNRGADRVLDHLTAASSESGALTFSLAGSTVSLYGLDAIASLPVAAKGIRMNLSPLAGISRDLEGTLADRGRRNALTMRRKALDLVSWLDGVVVRFEPEVLPQSLVLCGGSVPIGLSGACPLATQGLGLAAAAFPGLIQMSTVSG